MGGAVASKSWGRLLKRVEYLRITISPVLPPFGGGGLALDCGPPAGGFPPLLRGSSTPSLGIGPEICFGALIVGRPFLFPPLRRDIPFLSSDIVGGIHSEAYFVTTGSGEVDARLQGVCTIRSRVRNRHELPSCRISNQSDVGKQNNIQQRIAHMSAAVNLSNRERTGSRNDTKPSLEVTAASWSWSLKVELITKYKILSSLRKCVPGYMYLVRS
jgi:hypothetical protein